MNLAEFYDFVARIHNEVDRLHSVVEDPEQILSGFFDKYRPNLLQKIFEFRGLSEDELYGVLIDQLSTMDVLSNCRISKKVGENAGRQLLVSFRSPEFSLMVIDIKAKKYENVFESVIRGLSYNATDAETKRDIAQKNVEEAKGIDRSVRQLADGDIELRRRGAIIKKHNIRKYLRTLAYGKDTADNIVQDLPGFLASCKKEIDKRQAILAEAEKEYTHHLNLKREFDDNPDLHNTIDDLTELLKKHGYQQRDCIDEEDN